MLKMVLKMPANHLRGSFCAPEPWHRRVHGRQHHFMPGGANLGGVSLVWRMQTAFGVVSTVIAVSIGQR